MTSTGLNPITILHASTHSPTVHSREKYARNGLFSCHYVCWKYGTSPIFVQTRSQSVGDVLNTTPIAFTPHDLFQVPRQLPARPGQFFESVQMQIRILERRSERQAWQPLRYRNSFIDRDAARFALVGNNSMYNIKCTVVTSFPTCSPSVSVFDMPHVRAIS